MEGTSAMPLVVAERNESDPDWQDEVFIQISEAEIGRALRTKRWKYGVHDPNADGWSAAASDHYVERYLYDLDDDPYEQVNLIGCQEYEQVTVRLRERLTDHIEVVENSRPDIVSSSHHSTS